MRTISCAIIARIHEASGLALSPPIELIVGLGNPGGSYEQTRHNAGFWCVDALAQRNSGAFRVEAKFQAQACKISLAARECWLLKPATFMNRSGIAVAALAGFYKIPVENILVMHDELDLPPGVARLKQGGGHGGHNGLRDIIAQLGANFMRLRIGIGHPGDRDAVVDYVLQRPSLADRQQIEAAMDAALLVMPDVVNGEIQRAMHSLHSQPAA